MRRLFVVAYTRGDTPLDEIPVRFPEVDFHHCTEPSDAARLLPKAEILFIARRISQTEGNLLSPTLRWLHISGAGVDHVLPLLPQHVNPIITNSRGLSAELIAEYVFCLILMLRWKMVSAIEAQRARRWERWSSLPLRGQTLGVVGLGHIGQAVVICGQGFAMHILGARRNGGAVDGVDRVYKPHDLQHMFSKCDAIVVTVPLTPNTAGLIGAEEIGAMRATSVLVNVGRGGVVDESALADALRAGRISGAALDVFAEEPLPQSSPLWDLPNIIITSHIAGELPDIRERNTEFFQVNLRRFLDAKPLLSLVDRAKGY